MSNDPRAAFITGLRILAHVLQKHPEMPLPHIADTGVQWFPADRKDEVAAIARALPCRLDKRTWEAIDGSQSYLELAGQLGGLKVEINAWRDAVCTRRVVGTEEREVTETVTPAVTRKVTKTVEVVEWDCGSLLRPDGPSLAAVKVADPGEPGVNQAALPRDVVPGDLGAIPANRIGEPAPPPATKPPGSRPQRRRR